MDNLDTKRTTVHLGIRFREDGQYYHLLNYEVYPENIDEEDDTKLSAFPVRLAFSVEKTLETNDEIAEAIVNFLSSLKFYLHSYSITNNRIFVSYERKESAFNNGLTFSPTHQSLDLFVEAEVQKEDGVDYDKELSVKLHHSISAISPEEIENLGLELKETGTIIPTILHENELPDNY